MMTNKILSFLFECFHMPEACYQKQPYYFPAIVDLGAVPIFQENTGEYNLYNMRFPFQLLLIETKPTFATYAFLDAHSALFAHLPNDSETLGRLHRHNFFEFIYILEGQQDFLIEGTHRRYQAGDACLINPNVRHVEEHLFDSTILYLDFQSDFFSTLDLSSPDSRSLELLNFIKRNQNRNEHIDYVDFFLSNPGGEGKEKVDDCLLLAISELFHKAVCFEDLIPVYMKRLFTYLQDSSLYTCSNTRFLTSDNSSLFEQALSYIHSAKRKLTREELAAELNYSPNYVNQVFQKHTGQTLSSYIRNVCLTEAANLLLNSTQSVSEIIKQLGFENRTAFYRQFQKKYSMTPQEYRCLSRNRH